MKRRVLVVEDDPDIALVISLSLGIAGDQVTTVASGEAALEELPRLSPDVLVLDLGLPGMGGREVLRRVRSDPSLHRVRVVIVSANAAQPTICELAGLGGDYYLTKPFDPRELVRVVAEFPHSADSGTGVVPAL